jgi:hypothetical protein
VVAGTLAAMKQRDHEAFVLLLIALAVVLVITNM